MWDVLGKIGTIATIIGFILGVILFGEQSTTFPKVVTMLSSVMSPTSLEALAIMALSLALLICLTRQQSLGRRLAVLEQHIPQEEGERAENLPALVASEIAALIETLQTYHPTIKLIATEAGMELAHEFVPIFRTANCPLITDPDGNREIFPATLEHGRVIIRYREGDNTVRDSINSLIVTSLWTVLEHTPETLHFPKESNIDYIQIEIGGSL